MRLIDADALLKKLNNIGWYNNADRDEIAINAVYDAPIVDAVEVVRCWECKHYKGLAECDVIGDCMGTVGYCAWGERKEDGETD